ncbi:hypothetical protein [Streptomyces sp. NPDC052015]|uniref:hypothetical protein n=1 Tax=Streptomyces sp. NPDC052015 TaxID=3154755 RepID=UPI00342FD657
MSGCWCSVPPIAPHLGPQGQVPLTGPHRTRLEIPAVRSQVEWFGAGPGEAYPDSRQAVRVGRWIRVNAAVATAWGLICWRRGHQCDWVDAVVRRPQTRPTWGSPGTVSVSVTHCNRRPVMAISSACAARDRGLVPISRQSAPCWFGADFDGRNCGRLQVLVTWFGDA